MMKMVMAVMPKKCGDGLLSALVNAGYSATFHETRGGMLRQSQLSLFIAVKEAEVNKVIELIHHTCQSGGQIHYGFGLGQAQTSEAEPGAELADGSGGVIFVWTLDHFELP